MAPNNEHTIVNECVPASAITNKIDSYVIEVFSFHTCGQRKTIDVWTATCEYQILGPYRYNIELFVVAFSTRS